MIVRGMICTLQEVWRLFHEMHPDRERILQFIVRKIERKFIELGHLMDISKQSRPTVPENIQQVIILTAAENRHFT